MSPIPTQMTSHWWQRPGRVPGREQYHWHMLFHDQPKVHELVAAAQARIADQPGLDMIPIPWLHLTTQVSLGRVGYATEAIVLPAEPFDALTPVLKAVREATRAAGCHGHTDTSPWLPHISIAYSNTSIPTAPIIAALGRWLPRTEITIKSVSLVAQTQVGRSWQWRPVAEVHLG